MKNISVLGSTGSIGTQTLDVIRKNKDLKAVALAAGNNGELMEAQIREFSPAYVSMATEEAMQDIKTRTADLSGIEYGYGMEGLIHAATLAGADIVVTAVVGMMGILPTVEAIKAKKDIALANKETLVTAGHIIMELAKQEGVRILPVDSEHSAIFQCLNGEHGNRIHRILLTASGGPFRGRTREQMRDIQVEDALRHPNWVMGRKITIDSSTMVNKGLEVLEARWLFGVELSQIQVVVQPQSVIHSMVEFEDGAVMAQLGSPDMRLPIQYALYYPKRCFLDTPHLDFRKMKQITFEEPDMVNFRGLALAYEAGGRGGNVPVMLNAANELAVRLFLERRIKYLDIIDIIEQTMTDIEYIDNPNVEQILATEKAAYEYIRGKLRA